MDIPNCNIKTAIEGFTEVLAAEIDPVWKIRVSNNSYMIITMTLTDYPDFYHRTWGLLHACHEKDYRRKLRSSSLHEPESYDVAG